MSRPLFLILGLLSAATGMVGTVVPGLPTTIFMIIAAYCFGRSSTRFENWVLDHPHFGKTVRDWRAHRVVPMKAKYAASIMMSISLTIMLMAGTKLLVVGIASACMVCVATYLWLRPSEIQVSK
jgi:uncharacterized membrane protein YbaN (DUF454 family)